jgi:hypothetical protein
VFPPVEGEVNAGSAFPVHPLGFANAPNYSSPIGAPAVEKPQSSRIMISAYP